jgi:hypothetical protein
MKIASQTGGISSNYDHTDYDIYGNPIQDYYKQSSNIDVTIKTTSTTRAILKGIKIEKI